MPRSTDPFWRYGVALFPIPPLLSLIALGGMSAFISISAMESVTETGVLIALAIFVLTVLSFWLAIIVAVIVAGSVYLDARALAGNETWSPNEYVFGGIGLVHLAATELLVLNLLSVPSFLYYFYRRRQHVS